MRLIRAYNVRSMFCAVKRIALRLLLIGTLCLGCGLIGAATLPQLAHAEGYTASSIDVQKAEIEMLESAYREADGRAREAQARVAENQAKIDAIMEKLPAQQERTDAAIRKLYELQENKFSYMEVVLGAQTLDEFFKQLEYFDRVSKVNLKELNKLKDMLAELEEARVALDAAKAEADEQARIAQEALTAAQDERAARQASGQASAISQGGSSAVIDGANWHMTEEEFVAEWAPRIDAYLSGSPLEGTGETFALMSFRYCVDPRWSPAISNTESSKGVYCIRPHNAWGWGAADSDPYNLASEWPTWEEAIEAHVRGLSNGYGYTISKSAAEKYCSTPDSWYANTLSEMARI